MTMIIQNQNPRVYMISLGDISALLRIPIGVPRSIFILVFILQVYLRPLSGVYGDVPSLDEVDEHTVAFGAIVSRMDHELTISPKAAAYGEVPVFSFIVLKGTL
jgi:hypothetical protein